MPRKLLAVVLALGAIACEEDVPKLETPDQEVCLDRRDGQRYCIDLFEASRSDASDLSAGTDDLGEPRSLPNRLPWTNIGWAAARMACEGRGKRLCDLDEWVDACDGQVGPEGARYTYGDELDASRCNTEGVGVEPGGRRALCKSTAGTFDQSGNVWEWTGATLGVAAARGGGWRSSQTHRCSDVLMGIPPTEQTAEIGFRCCRTP